MVDETARTATRGEGLLIADEIGTVLADGMAGYGLMAQEIVDQVRTMGLERPTYQFVQAGVGGLAAALAEGIRSQMACDRRVVVVEPDKVLCSRWR